MCVWVYLNFYWAKRLRHTTWCSTVTARWTIWHLYQTNLLNDRFKPSTFLCFSRSEARRFSWFYTCRKLFDTQVRMNSHSTIITAKNTVDVTMAATVDCHTHSIFHCESDWKTVHFHLGDAIRINWVHNVFSDSDCKSQKKHHEMDFKSLRALPFEMDNATSTALREKNPITIQQN